MTKENDQMNRRGTDSFAPAGWETKYALSKRIGVAPETFQSLTQRVVQEHPEWIGEYSQRGQLRTLYSQELLSLAISQAQTFIDRKGRFKWALASKVNPELVRRYIEERVRTHLDNGIAITKPSLRAAMGNGTFPQTISLYYPGGYVALKEKFGLNHKGRLKEISDINPKSKSREDWTLERIELEARKVAEKNGGYITTTSLIKAGRPDLAYVIPRSYPGGIFALREELGYAHRRKQRKGYKRGDELFLDYLQQENTVDPSQLKNFIVNISNSKRAFIPIKSGIGKHIEIFIPRSESLRPGQRIICRPHYDEALDCIWLEGYVREGGKERRIFLRRFPKKERTVYRSKEPGIQSLADWIHGLIPFDRTQSVVITMEQKHKTINFARSDEKKIIIQLHKIPGLSQFDKVKLVPQKDEVYEWLEVHKMSEDDNSTRLSTYRISREKPQQLDGSWPGPERQRLREFLDGSLSPDKQLIPFTLPIKSGGRFYLIVYKGKSVELHLPPSLLPPGKTITISPTINAEGNLILSISTDENHVHQKFIFDKQTSKFIKLSESQNPIISPEEANEDLDRLLEGSI